MTPAGVELWRLAHDLGAAPVEHGTGAVEGPAPVPPTPLTARIAADLTHAGQVAQGWQR